MARYVIVSFVNPRDGVETRGFLPDFGIDRETSPRMGIPWLEGDSGDETAQTWYGVLTEDENDRFMAEFVEDATNEPNLGIITDYGHLEGDRYEMAGDLWEVGGILPFDYVSVSVSEKLQEWTLYKAETPE